MVWGMTLPEGFGEFWPSGWLEKDPATREDGWYDRLMNYFEEQSPEEQKRLFDYKGDDGNAARFYGSFPAYKLTKEPGTKDSSGLEPPYGPVEPHEIPRSLDTQKVCTTLGSLIKLNDKMLAVDEALKAVIEQLEPNVHEFFPIEIRMPKDKIYTGCYFILRVFQYYDAFSREQSWEGSVRELPAYQDTPGMIIINSSKKALNGLAVRKAAFGDAHLWRDRIFQEDLTCISDELMARIDRAGLRIPKHFKMKEV